MHNLFRTHVPRSWRARLRRVWYLPADLARNLSGRRSELKPPRGMMNVGAGDFTESGRKYLPLFIEWGGLLPSHRVLDVGCGIGHMAVVLASYLDEAGSYDGFDVVEQGVRWCQRNIAPRHPNFRFRRVDIRNSEYNPRGTILPSAFVFPYEDTGFDFVLLTSVFTHMQLPEIDRYLSEIRRVLRPGGCCFATYMLIDPDVSQETGPGLARFAHGLGRSRTIDVTSPDKAIAHPEADVRSLYHANALEVQKPVHYGDWRLHANLLGQQDIIIARRPDAPPVDLS